MISGIALFMLSLYAGISAAQTRAPDWPRRQITFVVPYAPGGFGDTRLRLVARKLSDKLGQPVVVENMAGADIGVGAAFVGQS